MDLASSRGISPQTETATLLPVELQRVTVSLGRLVGVPSERVTCFQWVFCDQTRLATVSVPILYVEFRVQTSGPEG